MTRNRQVLGKDSLCQIFTLYVNQDDNHANIMYSKLTTIHRSDGVQGTKESPKKDDICFLEESIRMLASCAHPKMATFSGGNDA